MNQIHKWCNDMSLLALVVSWGIVVVWKKLGSASLSKLCGTVSNMGEKGNVKCYSSTDEPYGHTWCIWTSQTVFFFLFKVKWAYIFFSKICKTLNKLLYYCGGKTRQGYHFFFKHEIKYPLFKEHRVNFYQLAQFRLRNHWQGNTVSPEADE